jgi:2-methylcitrate dehydratase PrpD
MTATVDVEQTDITEKISDYAVSFSYSDANETSITTAKLFTLECLGHMLSGSRQPVGALIMEMVRDQGAAEQATVIGGPFRTSIAEAAYVNGTLAHADELEACGTLPGTGLIPPITAGLAVGEARGSSGSDYLAALIAGVEVQGRLGTAVIGACDRGFMGFALVGPAGAGVAAGKLVGLDSAGMRMCLGAALPLAGGSLRGDGYMSHVHEAGVPARTGVWAALLAERGFTANPTYLDGPYSWGEQYVGPVANRPYNPGAILDGLGQSCFLETSDVAAKMYGASGVVHQAMEGVIRIMAEQQLRPEDIDSVKLVVPPFAKRIASFHEPATGEQAKFSLEQAVAGILVDGIPSVPYKAPFTDAGSRDERYVAARRRVDVSVDAALPNERGFAVQQVTVIQVDGTSHTTLVDRLDVPGRTGKPLSVDDRIAAFRRTADPLLGDQADWLVDIVMHFEKHSVGDIAEIVLPRSA